MIDGPIDVQCVITWRREGRYYERAAFERKFGLVTVPTARETYIMAHRLLTALPRDQYAEAIEMLAKNGHPLFQTQESAA